MPVLLPAPEPNSQLSSVLDIVDKAIKILAVVIGAGWAYLNYLRGRTFKKRLELRIPGRIIQGNGRLLLSGSAQIKNVGLSKFPIEQRGTAILVFDLRAKASVKQPVDMIEERSMVRSVFKDHAWIEPGETIEESFIVQLPECEGRAAMKLELRVVAAHIEWNANSIVELTIADNRTDVSRAPVRASTSTEKVSGGNMADRSFPAPSDSPEYTDLQIPERPEITDEIEKQKDKPGETDQEQDPANE